MKKAFLTLFVLAILAFSLHWAMDYYQLGNHGQMKSIRIENTNPQHTFHNGDIIFQTSTSNQSKAIQLATNSEYSHMGIIFEKDGKHLVYEAIQPVKFTPLSVWINRGKNRHYVVKRLQNAEELITQSVLHKMRQVAIQYEGRPYDLYFEWSNDKIYCSELVWKIYKEATGIEIGELEKLSHFDLNNDIVKNKLKERYGDKIPFDEKVISPAAMFNSKKLVIVAKN